MVVQANENKKTRTMQLIQGDYVHLAVVLTGLAKTAAEL